MSTKTRNPLKDKQIVYNQVFGNEAGKEVLADLRKFCHGTQTTFSSDPYEMALNEGKRQVFLQIMNMLKIDFEDIYEYDPVEYIRDHG